MHTVAMRTVTIRATAIQVRVQAARRLSGCVMVRYSTVARRHLLFRALPEQAHPDRTPRRLRPAPSPTQDASAACHVGLTMSTVARGVQGGGMWLALVARLVCYARWLEFCACRDRVINSTWNM